MMQENLLKEYGLYINGEWRSASDGATFSSTDPATGEHLAVCAEATKVDVDNAVKAAQKAFETWKDELLHNRFGLYHVADSFRYRTATVIR